MQAMRFAVQEINNLSGLLPGVRLGYEMVDVCYASNNVQPVLFFLAGEDSLLPIQGDYSHYVPRVVAVVGPDSSESAMTVAHFLSLLLLPQVGEAPGPWEKGPGRGGRGEVAQRAHLPLPVTGRRWEQRRGQDMDPNTGKAPGLLVESLGFGGRRTGSCVWALSLAHRETFRCTSLSSSEPQSSHCKVR